MQLVASLASNYQMKPRHLSRTICVYLQLSHAILCLSPSVIAHQLSHYRSHNLIISHTISPHTQSSMSCHLWIEPGRCCYFASHCEPFQTGLDSTDRRFKTHPSSCHPYIASLQSSVDNRCIIQHLSYCTDTSISATASTPQLLH